jgi:2,4-dienoyl-CoA reductase (NADPH2)
MVRSTGKGETQMTKYNKFEKLLEPGSIGSVKTRNRLIKTAAGLAFWNKGQEDPNNDKVKYLYEALAKGGVGLIIMESPHQDAAGKGFRVNDAKGIQSAQVITKLIHKYNCPVFAQLTSMANWAGAKSAKLFHPDAKGASAIRIVANTDNHNTMPREMTIPEIQEIIETFVITALGAREAGFDGVEINASCSHLLSTFISPFWNKRQDIYGCQSLENRTRMVVEIIREIKKRAGKDFPISTLINGFETGKLIGVDDSECLSLDDSTQIAQILEKAGADAVQVRSQWIGRHNASFLTDHMCYPEPPIPFKDFPKDYDKSRRGVGANQNLAAAVRNVVSIPVITVGRLDPELGEKILREGKADFIAMSRRLWADPELPNKIASGRLEDIAPCTSCTMCKTEAKPRSCRINGAIGRDQPYFIEPASQKKKVVVIGGGPGGMEAARVAAIRGHEVILWERGPKLGGLLPLAAMVKGTEIEEIPAIVHYFRYQLNKLKVKINLGQEATQPLIEEMKPDVVILATGGITASLDIPGINNPKVVSNTELHRKLKLFLRFFSPDMLRRLTNLWMPIGKDVVIVGGGIQGCELAEFLVKRGRRVTLVGTEEAFGEEIPEHLRMQLFWWFNKKGVVLMQGVKPIKITQRGLTVLNKDNYAQTLKADTIIPALPMKPNLELYKSLQGKIPEVFVMGDCKEPRLMVDAIGEAYELTRSI